MSLIKAIECAVKGHISVTGIFYGKTRSVYYKMKCSRCGALIGAAREQLNGKSANGTNKVG